MTDTSQIDESILSLKTETSPNSVTPERVGNLLQAVVDLIKALSTVPEEDVVSIMTAVNGAVSAANAARQAASNAVSSANGKEIVLVEFAAAEDGMTLTVKQSAHSAICVVVPVADASRAGIVLPQTLQKIEDAAGLAEDGKLTSVSLQYTTAGINLVFKGANGDTLCSRTLPLVSSVRAGLMSAQDKEKLDALPGSGVVALDEAGRVPAAQAPQVMIRNVAETTLDNLATGDFYFDSGKIWYKKSDTESVNMGVPSKNVVYCHTDTNVLYRWTGSAFSPAMTDPNYAMQVVEVRKSNSTRKTYTVPNGKLARMIVDSDVVNVVLEPANSGASVHRMIFSTDNFEQCVQINWPDGLVWDEGIVPDVEHIDNNYGAMVTVYDMKWAEYKVYKA